MRPEIRFQMNEIQKKAEISKKKMKMYNELPKLLNCVLDKPLHPHPRGPAPRGFMTDLLLENIRE